jgi:hypothetical protein
MIVDAWVGATSVALSVGGQSLSYSLTQRSMMSP